MMEEQNRIEGRRRTRANGGTLEVPVCTTKTKRQVGGKNVHSSAQKDFSTYTQGSLMRYLVQSPSQLPGMVQKQVSSLHMSSSSLIEGAEGKNSDLSNCDVSVVQYCKNTYQSDSVFVSESCDQGELLTVKSNDAITAPDTTRSKVSNKCRVISTVERTDSLSVTMMDDQDVGASVIALDSMHTSDILLRSLPPLRSFSDSSVRHLLKQSDLRELMSSNMEQLRAGMASLLCEQKTATDQLKNSILNQHVAFNKQAALSRLTISTLSDKVEKLEKELVVLKNNQKSIRDNGIQTLKNTQKLMLCPRAESNVKSLLSQGVQTSVILDEEHTEEHSLDDVGIVEVEVPGSITHSPLLDIPSEQPALKRRKTKKDLQPFHLTNEQKGLLPTRDNIAKLTETSGSTYSTVCNGLQSVMRKKQEVASQKFLQNQTSQRTNQPTTTIFNHWNMNAPTFVPATVAVEVPTLVQGRETSIEHDLSSLSYILLYPMHSLLNTKGEEEFLNRSSFLKLCEMDKSLNIIKTSDIKAVTMVNNQSCIKGKATLISFFSSLVRQQVCNNQGIFAFFGILVDDQESSITRVLQFLQKRRNQGIRHTNREDHVTALVPWHGGLLVNDETKKNAQSTTNDINVIVRDVTDVGKWNCVNSQP